MQPFPGCAPHSLSMPPSPRSAPHSPLSLPHCSQGSPGAPGAVRLPPLVFVLWGSAPLLCSLWLTHTQNTVRKSFSCCSCKVLFIPRLSLRKPFSLSATQYMSDPKNPISPYFEAFTFEIQQIIFYSFISKIPSGRWI